MKIKGTKIQAKTRKLKSKWSTEAAQDLAAYHGISVSAQDLADAIDRDIFEDMKNRRVRLKIGGSVFLG